MCFSTENKYCNNEDQIKARNFIPLNHIRLTTWRNRSVVKSNPIQDSRCNKRLPSLHETD